MASRYKAELDEMVWSFSRIKCYEQCPYSFYLKYIDKDEVPESNFYAENGIIFHEICERLLKKEIDIRDAPKEYTDKFDGILNTTKKSIMNKCFDDCIEYLCDVDEFDFDKYDVLGVEKYIEFKIGKYKFIGYIDVLLRDKVTGDVIVLDHKSSSGDIFKKDGTLKKGKEEQFGSYKKQLYLYCNPVIKEYGEPTYLAWHHFREHGRINKIRFDKKEYNETLEWAKNTIKTIYNDKKFTEKCDWFYCNNLCDFRGCCGLKDFSQE